MPLPPPRFTVAGLMLLVAVAALGAVVIFPPKLSVIETLDSPVAVAGWSTDALRLADGRTVTLPETTSLPASSPLLSEVTGRGVEVSSDGRIYGLLRIHHWCGNDRVKNHLARVDVALLLEYFGVAKSSATPSKWTPGSSSPGGRFSLSGWDISEYYDFGAWSRLTQADRGKPPPR